MKMTGIEKFFVRSSLRVYLQRKFEAPGVLSNLNIGNGSVCLEIGCGHGAGALLINQYLGCKRIVGVDIDPDMMKAAKRYISRPPKWAKNVRTDNIEFICQDAAKLPFPDGYFDAAFLFGVLDHIKNWPAVIAEVFRVLKVGGIFSFEEFLLSPSASGRLGHVSIRETELREALASTGFSIQSFQVTKRIRRCFVRAVKSV
ncbi:class I SAM-dependent methyltransferase [Chloroflexota bacterium]